MPLHVPPDRSHPASYAGTGNGISCSHPQDTMSRSRLWHRRKPQSPSYPPNTSGSPRCCRTTRRTQPQGSSCSCKPEARYGGVGLQMTDHRNSSCSVAESRELGGYLVEALPKRDMPGIPVTHVRIKALVLTVPLANIVEKRLPFDVDPSNSSIRFACASCRF